jgi:hypothetical protein
VANNWPTHRDPLLDLAKLHTVSLRAQEYDPVVFYLHIEHHPDLTLRTRDQLSTEAHRLSTPRFLAVWTPPVTNNVPPVAGPPVTFPTAPSTATAQQILASAQAAQTYPGSSYQNPYLLGTHQGGGFLAQHQPPTLPHPPALYSPPALQPQRHTNAPATQQARQLFTPFGSAVALQGTPLITVARNSDPTQATIITEQGRHKASLEFLHCCRLLVHNDVRVQLTDSVTGQILATHANLFPCQPTLHFRQDVLGPLYHKMQGYQPSMYNYVEALLSWSGIPVLGSLLISPQVFVGSIKVASTASCLIGLLLPVVYC